MNRGICFLDFDGVINTLNIKYENDKFITEYFYHRDRKVNNTQAILWISKLCIENNLDIFIISSWAKICPKNELEKILRNSGLVNKINIFGTIDKREDRVEYINRVLHENLNLQEKYIILDDESTFYDNSDDLYKHLILCNPNYGFGFEEYRLASEKLNNMEKRKVLK